ncbi:MAG: MATE family efflux transporter [Pseudomonadales bacterium]
MTDLTLPHSPAAWHRRVWSLSWPVIAANVTVPLVGLVDTAVMGRMPDAAYVGAVAVGAAIFNAIYWIFGFLRMGTTGLAAQALGARDPAELTAVAIRGATIALGIGGGVVLLQWPLAQGLFQLFQASGRVEDLASTYFHIRIWGAPAQMLYMVVLGALFALQRMRLALGLSILLNVTNIVLDLLLVLGLNWGVTGVAVATLVSEWLATLIGLRLLYRLLGGRSAPLDRLRLWDRDRLRGLIGMSGNLVVRSFFVQLPFFVFTLIGAGLGDLVLAANAIVMQIFMTLGFALDGPAQTAETLCGYAFGARDRPGFRAATRYSLIWSAGMAAVLSLVIAAGGETFVAWITVLPELREAAGALLPWAVAAPLVAVWAFLLDGVYIGTTQTATLRNCMFAAAMLYLLTIWLFLDTLGNLALWIAMMVFMASRGVLLGALYPRLERKLTPPQLA